MSEETTEKRKVTQPFNIKLYPDEIDRFKKIKGEMDDVSTDRGALIALLDFFENPKTVEIDNPKLKQRIAELEQQLKNNEDTIARLNKKVEETQQEANLNGESGSKLQIHIDELEQQLEELEAENSSLRKQQLPANYVGGTMDAVPLYFLRKMAKLQSARDKKERSEFWILANNFIQDLQNPLSNHLPLTVSSDELRRAQADYEKQMKAKEVADADE